MDETTIGLTILGMGVVTYLPRLLPLLLLRRGEKGSCALSPYLEAWLQQIPVAVLAAMAFHAVLPSAGDPPSIDVDPLYLGAALPTMWVAWRTHSLVGAVLTGTALVALGRWLLS
jgi:branched-subunit amino acid transport protein